MTYNPYVDITKETTTLYASDGMCSCFWSMTPILSKRANCPMASRISISRVLCLEQRGRLETLGIATFYLRGVCANRCLWGWKISRK
jgi:hypothetical protein